MRQLVPLWILILALQGCSFFHHHRSRVAAVSPSPTISQIEGKVLQKSSLLRGGRLLIVPFNPGVDVSADDAFGKTSLMMVKGISQTLQQSQSSPFTLLMANNADQANLFLKGHVVKMETKSTWGKWMTKKKYKVMAVNGKLIDQITGEDILLFHHTKEANTPAESWDDLALAVGEDIGNFILNNLQ